LLDLLALSPSFLPGARKAAQLFPLRVPRGYIARMQRGNVDDPLLKQVLPLNDELLDVKDFNLDPVGDLNAMSVPGLLHKYHGRVLLVTTGACAVHCRYCFRRHFPYSDSNPTKDSWGNALRYITANTTINEVILSGGDPLVLSDHRLDELVTQLEAIPHVERLRLHSRLPVVLPERINDDLLLWIRKTHLDVVLVIHANHANEIDNTVATALSRLTSAGVILLNQSVLLRGINDSCEALEALSHRLFSVGVLPYYLHLLDRVKGAAHFEVNHQNITPLYEKLLARLPGYLVPRLVREIAQAPNKTIVYP